MQPVETVLAAAELFEKRAREATPGPWRRPLDTRHKKEVVAPLPEGERGRYIDGRDIDGNREKVLVVECGTWSNGRHSRRRSGRDLEWIALADPRLGPPLAALMRAAAKSAQRFHDPLVQASLIGPEVLEIAYNTLETPEDERIDVEAIYRGEL